MKKIIFLIVALNFLTCERILIPDRLEDSYSDVFNSFWEEFDQHYSYFGLKQIDWNLVKSVNEPLVADFTSDEEMLNLFDSMIQSLKDVHVNVYAPNTVLAFDARQGYPENTADLADKYLLEQIRTNNTISHGEIAGTNLAYIKIDRFSGSLSEFAVFTDILSSYGDKDGLVLDIRSNGGGSDENGNFIASHFASEDKVYRKFRYRNGPSHDDFTDWFESKITASPNPFEKPVALLINRGCASACENFIASLKVYDQVITFGGITAGGSGNPIYRELPNGWAFRLSNWQVDFVPFGMVEGVGIEPDFPIDISESDMVDEIDAILERAIEFLEQ